jgi:hypothetical protein
MKGASRVSSSSHAKRAACTEDSEVALPPVQPKVAILAVSVGRTATFSSGTLSL